MKQNVKKTASVSNHAPIKSSDYRMKTAAPGLFLVLRCCVYPAATVLRSVPMEL